MTGTNTRTQVTSAHDRHPEADVIVLGVGTCGEGR
jgi:hypothetical protein